MVTSQPRADRAYQQRLSERSGQFAQPYCRHDRQVVSEGLPSDYDEEPSMWFLDDFADDVQTSRNDDGSSEFNHALEAIWTHVGRCNKYIDVTMP